MCSLTVLDIHDNQLESLPDSIGDLQRMSKLNLSHNRFKEIPQGVFLMKELRVLQLSNNNIEIVDEKVGDLNMLNNFDLANNVIKVFFLINTTENTLLLFSHFLKVLDASVRSLI